MPHNCSPDWIYVMVLGCFQSWSQFYGFLMEVMVTAVGIGSTLLAMSRFTQNQQTASQE